MTSRYRELTVFQKKNPLISVYEKITSQSLETPPILPLFSARNILRARSTLMHLVYGNKNILFSVYSS